MGSTGTVRRIDGYYTKSQTGNPSVSVTRPDNTTAYTAGDIFGTSPATNIEFENVLPEDSQSYYIVGAKIVYNASAAKANMDTFTLHLYDSAPTAIVDNSAWTLLSADRAKYLGSIEIDLPTDLGEVLVSFKDNINLKRQLASGSTSVYGQLVTNGAFTPGAEDVLDISLQIVGA